MRGSQLGEQSYLAVERPKKLGRTLVVKIAGQSLTVSRKKKNRQ